MSRNYGRSGSDAFDAFASGLLLVIVVVAISLGVDLLYAWLLTIAVNSNFHTHLVTRNMFWLVMVCGSFITYQAAVAVRSSIKKHYRS